ncbi:ABC transporter substrate-binding protein [Bradyrhizobium sp. CCBAU 51745]|uniref:ABC transporter substrate-binding protein n=1 Tax=Bradyrhizobium sp. CCBAU 51745 TaxID=1325099 RepID=UPI00230531DB|nr:ABC transporter substrate-binding protein [Bradyrhizobium sp. CCBAU 51745]
MREILAPYKARLEALGWVEGRNVQFLVRAWDGDAGSMRLQAGELVAAHPDVIVALSNPAVAILKPLGGNVPIVFGMVADPAGSGFIQNLARPGGTITGFTNFEASMGGKWLEVLREAAPDTTRVLVFMHPETAAHKEFFGAIESLAGPLKIQVTAAGIHNSAEVERAFAEFIASGSRGGVIALPHAITEVNRDLIIQRATANFMPTIFAFEAHAYAGALVTYGIDRSDTIMQTADYVDRILRGTRPADLPVQAAQKFELVVNLKTAKALGLTISPTLLGRADKVIE